MISGVMASWLNHVSFLGFPLGYYMAAQGSLAIFVIEIAVYAYLMKSNGPAEQKLVMAHVFGHADFFKNNLWFSKTNRRMIDAMANHATRVRSHIDRHGLEAVEDFIDACLSLENLIDAHGDFIERQEKRDRARHETDADEETQAVPRLKSKAYMEPYINPPAFLEQQKAKLAERARKKRQVPEEPQRDILPETAADRLRAMSEAHYLAPEPVTAQGKS